MLHAVEKRMPVEYFVNDLTLGNLLIEKGGDTN